MCGIYAVINDNDAVEKTLRGLQDLEYRGYDSFGISTLYDGKIYTFRTVGKPSDYTLLHLRLPPGRIAIGHTRWATHGQVELKNAHPIEYGDWVVVHNGIIENHEEFKFDRKTDTDTEVIPYLLSQGLNPNELLKGKLTYVAMSPAKIIARADGYSLAQRKLGTDSYILTSFSPFEDAYYYGEIKEFEYVDTKNIIKRAAKEIIANWDNPKSFDFDYKKMPSYHINPKGFYTLNELNEIPATKILIPQDLELEHDPILIGSGSSYYAAMLAKYFAYWIDVVPASEFDLIMDHPCKTIIALSQSGETYDVLNAVKQVKQFKNHQIVAITNYKDSSLGRMADSVIELNVGYERAVAATKSFYAQCIAIHSLFHVSILDTDIRPKIETLEEILKCETIISSDKLCILGTGKNYVAALEGSLKFKELAYTWAEGIQSGEFKHGPLALVDSDFVAILLDDHPIADQIKARGGQVIRSPCSGFFENVVWLQKVAYNTAIARGINPDYPRNLAKSITTK